MKVKSLYPIIVTSEVEETIKFYKNLGFEIKHDLKTLKGFHVYVLNNDELEIEIMEKPAEGPLKNENGLYGFRMNVDSIQDAYEELKGLDYKVIGEPFETASGKNLLIMDNLGTHITLIEHIKK